MHRTRRCWLTAAGNELSTNLSRCPMAASSSRSRMPANTSRSFRRPSTRRRSGVSVRQMMARRGGPLGASAAAPTGRWGAALCLDSSYPEPDLGTDIAYRVQRLPMGMMLMLRTRTSFRHCWVSAVGVLKIPAMDTALRLPIKVSPRPLPIS